MATKTLNTKTILNIKTDKKLKLSAQKIAGKIGVPLSTVMNAFLRQFVADERVTFGTKSSSYDATPYLQEIIKEAKKDFKKSQNIA